MRKYRQRIHYTEADKNMMWERWRKGDSLESIAQLFDRTHGSVARILRRTGGIRPPKRTRSSRTLSLAEREEISRGVVAGQSLRSIATSLKRCTIDGQQRDQPQWRPTALPSQRGRSSSLGSVPSPQDL